MQRFRGVRGRDGGENEVPNLDSELFKWSFESVGRVLFDRRFDVVGDGNNPEGEDFISAVEKVRDVMFPASMFPIWFYKNIYETKAFKTFVENYDKIYSYLTEAEGIGRRRQARRNQRRGSRISAFSPV